jgi:hypothetical protein
MAALVEPVALVVYREPWVLVALVAPVVPQVLRVLTCMLVDLLDTTME